MGIMEDDVVVVVAVVVIVVAIGLSTTLAEAAEVVEGMAGSSSMVNDDTMLLRMRDRREVVGIDVVSVTDSSLPSTTTPWIVAPMCRGRCHCCCHSADLDDDVVKDDDGSSSRKPSTGWW